MPGPATAGARPYGLCSCPSPPRWGARERAKIRAARCMPLEERRVGAAHLFLIVFWNAFWIQVQNFFNSFPPPWAFLFSCRQKLVEVTSTTRTTITITSSALERHCKLVLSSCVRLLDTAKRQKKHFQGTEGFLDCSEIRPWANLVLQTMGGMAFWKEPYILKVARLLVS